VNEECSQNPNDQAQFTVEIILKSFSSLKLLLAKQALMSSSACSILYNFSWLPLFFLQLWFIVKIVKKSGYAAHCLH
jgi:hypothetical protein